MFDLKTIVTSLVVSLVVVFGVGLVGGNQSESLGASGSRFPYGVSTDTTSPVFGQVRGSSFAFTSSGNKIGSDTSVNYTYYGAGDGCTAVFFTSSSTQVTHATSTAFCN